MKLTLQDIPRVKAGLVASTGSKDLNELDQERFYLATRAKDLLGYDALSGDVTGEKKIGKSEGKLTEGLRALEIQVLDTATVIEYQLEEATRLTRELIHDRLHDWVAGWFSAASWGHTLLREYTRPVPEHVLDKAIRIKEHIPEVEFIIQHMSDPKADPFLIAKLGYEIYYIEAWDEPRFEGRVTR